MVRSNKKTIHDLTREWPTSAEMDALRDALTQHSGVPIVVALLGTAMIEYELERLLRSRFRRQDDTTWGRLVGDNGPLNSLAAKITAGHAFGLYDEEFRRALNVIKNIRNVFAHSKKLVDFSHHLISEELARLPQVKSRVDFWTQVRWIRKRKPPNRFAFIILCYSANTLLIKRGTKMMRSKTKSIESRRRRRYAKSPYAGALTNYLAGIGKGLPRSGLEGLLGFGTDDPKVPNSLLTLAGIGRKSGPDSDNEDNKD